MPTRAEYEELRRSFRLEVPDRFNYVRDVLYDRAHAHRGDLALARASQPPASRWSAGGP